VKLWAISSRQELAAAQAAQQQPLQQGKHAAKEQQQQAIGVMSALPAYQSFTGHSGAVTGGMLPIICMCCTPLHNGASMVSLVHCLGQQGHSVCAAVTHSFGQPGSHLLLPGRTACAHALT
jgi:hypothetical protein